MFNRPLILFLDPFKEFPPLFFFLLALRWTLAFTSSLTFSRKVRGIVLIRALLWSGLKDAAGVPSRQGLVEAPASVRFFFLQFNSPGEGVIHLPSGMWTRNGIRFFSPPSPFSLEARNLASLPQWREHFPLPPSLWAVGRRPLSRTFLSLLTRLCVLISLFSPPIIPARSWFAEASPPHFQFGGGLRFPLLVFRDARPPPPKLSLRLEQPNPEKVRSPTPIS